MKFHDGRPLTSRDVKWTFDSLLQGKIRSTKSAVYRFNDRIEAPDDFTVVFRMKQQDATLLWNLSDGAIGIVPFGSGDEMTQHPIGSGPFKFVSAMKTDPRRDRHRAQWRLCKETHRNFPACASPSFPTKPPKLSGNCAKAAATSRSNASLTPDTVQALSGDPSLAIERGHGTRLAYLAFNVRDPLLKDVRVRQRLSPPTRTLDRRARMIQ